MFIREYTLDDGKQGIALFHKHCVPIAGGKGETKEEALKALENELKGQIDRYKKALKLVQNMIDGNEEAD